MSKHNIHGANVNITVSQVADHDKGKCIGRVVNICRDMPRDVFLRAIDAFDRIPGNDATVEDYQVSGKILNEIDNQLFGDAIANISRA